MLSAVGEHGAFMIGYAKSNSHSQLYTCHKLLEFGIGLPMQVNDFPSVYPADFTYNLPNKSLSSIVGAII